MCLLRVARHATPKSLTPAQVRVILAQLGWPQNVALDRAVRAFQEGWNLGPDPLKPDGVVGPLTSDALFASSARGNAGLPTASTHFSFHEFACKCGASAIGCKGVLVIRELLESLELLRERFYPHGLPIVSGYRCEVYNHHVGGARESQHIYGAAADVQYVVDWQHVAKNRLFAGIGKSARTGLVRHVDRRDVSGSNTTGSSLANPEVWDYPA